ATMREKARGAATLTRARGGSQGVVTTDVTPRARSRRGGQDRGGQERDGQERDGQERDGQERRRTDKFAGAPRFGARPPAQCTYCTQACPTTGVGAVSGWLAAVTTGSPKVSARNTRARIRAPSCSGERPALRISAARKSRGR